MDRSFLSDPEVIAASRSFVCIRLATYESAEEAKVLKSYFIGRSGDLENTTFALLAPDGRRIGRGGRSPRHLFEDAGDMADEMRRIAAQYPARRERRELPVMKSVRLAIDVASCDRVPLVVALEPRPADLARLEENLATVAWMDSLQGRFAWVSTSRAADLAQVSGVTRSRGVIVVEPDTYGLEGKVLAELDPGASASAIAAALGKVRARFVAPEKDPRTHIREGHRRGIKWITEIPDTDPGPPGGHFPEENGPPDGRGGPPPR